ncbi:hypothetical protein [Jannaschia aquimarina]|uniref:Uncharacterized protein n=1 Tax=Jannaschia aquimarina TaxID=935700 RepID=A0A0D1CK60_9RHOB|nr:hypothetical protein [Jannaschia aquimarina]KIT15132.1 hypothetical protein jaqu_34600 [Jannaschia aquimarina]SNS64946.1 hypothetical protein SAMN05421775_101786 [Jannaschia aquimarina]
MSRSLIAALVALALSLPAATPARADAEDVAKVVGGLVLLYALKEAIENRNDRRDRSREVRRDRRDYYDPIIRSPRPHRRPGNQVLRRDDRSIPADCLRSLRTLDGVVTGYGARCAQNRVRRAGSLPPQCLRQVRGFERTRTLYSPRCLARNGWAIPPAYRNLASRR